MPLLTWRIVQATLALENLCMGALGAEALVQIALVTLIVPHLVSI